MTELNSAHITAMQEYFRTANLMVTPVVGYWNDETLFGYREFHRLFLQVGTSHMLQPPVTLEEIHIELREKMGYAPAAEGSMESAPMVPESKVVPDPVVEVPPVETPPETKPEEAPVDQPPVEPVQEEVPVEAAKEVPVDTPADTPADTKIEEAPMDPPKSAVKEEAPAEAKKIKNR